MLFFQLIQPSKLLRASKVSFGVFGKGRKKGGMSPSRLGSSAGSVQSLHCILPDRLQHGKALFVPNLTLMPDQVPAQKGSKPSPGRLDCFMSVIPGYLTTQHGLHTLSRKSTRKDRQRIEQALLLRVK